VPTARQLQGPHSAKKKFSAKLVQGLVQAAEQC
jgi:hypothetical protein